MKANNAVGFGTQTCTTAIGTEPLISIHYEQLLGFRTNWPSLNSNQWQKWEAAISLHHLWKSLTQYIHSPVLKREITSKTKFITSLSLHLERRNRLTGSLETITVWQISGAFISKNLSQLFTSSSVFRGQAENSGGYSKSKSFVSERKTLVSRYFSLSTFLHFSPPHYSVHIPSCLKEAHQCPLLCFCQKFKQPEYCFFHCTGIGRTTQVRICLLVHFRSSVILKKSIVSYKYHLSSGISFKFILQ